MSEMELPPVHGKIYTFTLDATSRVKDLGALDFGEQRLELGGTMVLCMQSSAAFHYKFGPTNSMTVDDVAADAAGAAPTFQANGAGLAPANETVVFTKWNRIAHRYLAVKGGTSIVRIWVGSKRTNR